MYVISTCQRLSLSTIYQNGKINLTLEIKLLTDEAQYQKNQIRQLLMEKEKFEHDAEVANQQYYTALEVRALT